MTRVRAVLAAALLVAIGATAGRAQTVTVDRSNQSVTADMQALPVRVGGRVETVPLPAPMPAGATRFRHEWPGVYFEAAFRGDRVVLRFDDPANEYRLLIDDLPAIPLAQPGTAEITIGGLADGLHSLRLEKVTESIGLPESFEGFYVPAQARALALPPPRPRQIEFIGDSGMAGYGSRSPVRECTKEQVRLLTDTQTAYVALTAKHFDADYQVNAISGRGMVRNYAGEAPEAPMPALYDRALFSEQGAWPDESWQPQIIVVGLYGNDFSTDLNPGEKWTDESQLLADFAASYGRFLGELHRRSPDAAVLAIWHDLGHDPGAPEWEAARLEIAAAARAHGIRTILFPVLSEVGLERSACDYHRSLADHRQLATWLTGYIEARPELWQGE